MGFLCSLYDFQFSARPFFSVQHYKIRYTSTHQNHLICGDSSAIYAWIEMSGIVWKTEPSLNIRHLWQEWYLDCLTFNASKCLCRKFAAQKPQTVLIETQQPTITITTRIHLNTLAQRNKCASLHTEYIDRIGDSTCQSYCHVQFFGSSAFSFCFNFFFLFILLPLLVFFVLLLFHSLHSFLPFARI